MNETHELGRRSSNSSTTQNAGSSTSSSSSGGNGGPLRRVMDCLPLSHGVGTHHPHLMASSNTVNVTVAPPSAVVAAYPHHHHLNLNHHHLLSHHLPYTSTYSGLHHTTSSTANSQHLNHTHLNIHSEQTKSLQELQHEVGALLEFRDLVIETFPDLKHKMASISSAASTSSSTGGGCMSGNVLTNGQSVSVSVSGNGSTTTLTSGGTLVSRREWEPGIRGKRKISQKEQPAAIELTSSSSLTRSRSNSHSGKKEPKSSSGGGGATSGGENNNGSVVQDSGFSTETSSSKEGHSASSTSGALTGAIPSNRLSCPESDDELLNLLDVIHRKSNRLREEVEHLQNYERQHLQQSSSGARSVAGDRDRDHPDLATSAEGATALSKSSSSSANTALTPKTFREHVERLNKEDLQQLRKERDRLLDKLAEMEAETLTGRIKAAKMSEQVEELINVKRDLEEQLKLAMAQRLELNSRVQLLQQQQQQSKSSTSQSDFSSSPRAFLSSSATTVLSTVSANSSRQNTFQPVLVEQHTTSPDQHHLIPFHQSVGSDNKRNSQLQTFSPEQLGRLDGIVSTPGDRNAKCRVTDSKRFAAILLETSVIELQRHLLTLTVKNQVLMQKLEQISKSKGHLVKRLDKSKDDNEDLKFQLEEKNIELEGTKAQLRVLESRLHSITPSSGAATNSYLHSQHDYETNRSSTSTTLMLSRRGVGLDSSDIRSSTPIPNGQMPQPTITQISTPSMKAMTHLAMDDMQHHSSSTESAHEHDVLGHDHPHHDTLASNQLQTKLENGRDIRQTLMSTSVGGVSPFEQQLQQQQVAAIRNQVQALKKFSGMTTAKPSKIPLPGSKAAAYFAGKPPSGRPLTAGRSPTSANSSGSSSRSPLSRSTGNLLYSKSPNSLKRADSAQSIRKDNHNSSSLSTNTSRSSTSSSIPMSTTPYSSTFKSYGGGGGGGGTSFNNTTTATATTLNSPSSRILQNSPLPKPKRESLSTKVRHMDSLSRAYHQHTPTSHNYSNISNSIDNTPTTIVQSSNSPATTPGGGNGAGSYLISSTPKPSTIAAQLTSSLRKDLQLSTSHQQQQLQPFQRRATGGLSSASSAGASTNAVITARRFSSASVVGARATRQVLDNNEHISNISGNSVAAVLSTNSSSSHGGGNNGGTASDSDSGKNFSYDKNCGNNNDIKSGLNQYFEEDLISCTTTMNQNLMLPPATIKITLSQYFEKELLKETSAADNNFITETPAQNDSNSIVVFEDDNDEIDIYTSYASYMSSSDPGSDNLLVTFDYGSQNSLEADLLSVDLNYQQGNNEENQKNLFQIQEESSEDISHDQMVRKPANLFKVHRIQDISSENLLQVPSHEFIKNSQYAFEVHQMEHDIETRASSCTSLANSLVELNVDTSGDYGSWQQSDSEEEKSTRSRNYCYEDLIKNETNDDDGDDGNVNLTGDGDNRNEVLIQFNFDEGFSPRWFNHTDTFFYKSLDYLN